MKKTIYILILSCCVSFLSCELDLPNPNAATEQEVFTTKDGLTALAIGIRQHYSTLGLGSAVLVPSVSTRETAIMTTFANLEELEEGAAKLSGENGYTTRLFTRLMKAKGMAENLIANVDNVSLEPGTASGLKAWGHLFKAMCLGHLAHNFEQVAINNSLNNDAVYSDRMDAYREAVNLLNAATSLLEGTAPSPEFLSSVAGDIDVLNSCYAMLSRYNLMVGDHAATVTAADKVDLSSTSLFTYDGQNSNPVFEGFFVGTVEYAPRSNFGLPASLAFDPADGRIAFYIDPNVNESSLNVLPVSAMVAPFYNNSTASIPLYLPGEMMLNKAEAFARQNKLSDAEAALNAVRNKMPADDVYGIGAGLPDTYSAGGDQDALLAEIYKNRRLELFLIGTSLEDSRRFNRPEPPQTTDFTSERNRNFYPYPDVERQNNSNTPPNPAI